MLRRVLQSLAAIMALTLSLAISVPPARADNVSDLLGWVNSLRAGRGLAPLAVDPTLTSVAQQWSAHMAATGTLAHNPNLYTIVPSGWGKLGENVGVGGSALGLFNAFTADPAHLANMLDPAYNRTGISVLARNGSLWVTQDFEQVAGTAQPGPTTPATTAPAPVTLPPTTRPASRAAPRVVTTTPATTAPTVASTTVVTAPTTTTITSVAPITPLADPGIVTPLTVPGVGSQAISSVGTGGRHGQSAGGWASALAAAGVLAGLTGAIGAVRRARKLP